jgi:hypothetical protein
MSRILLGGAAAVVTVLLGACGGTPTGDPSLPANPSSASTTALSSAAPTPSRSSTAVPSPTASRTADRREDLAALRQALVTAGDLGRPWVVVKGDPPSGAVEAGCPGKPGAVRRLSPVAEVRRYLTEGPGELINGASFGLATLRDTDGSAVRAAWRADTRACREYTDADGFYVIYRATEPTSVRGADEVLLRRVERIYFDRGDPKPAYARHTLVVRTGRLVATVTYSFLTSKSDPDAGDFSQATELLQTQLSKAAKAFGE